jgi:hypothetical protein
MAGRTLDFLDPGGAENQFFKLIVAFGADKAINRHGFELLDNECFGRWSELFERKKRTTLPVR